MIYLLAKFTLLFLLTAVLGFILGYWWSRRKFVDVSESYEDLRRANDRSDASNWSQLWQRFDDMPQPKEVSLSAVYERIDGVTEALVNIPQPAPVSLATVESGLLSLTNKVAGIPLPVTPKDPDLRPVLERMEKLERVVTAMPAPADLSPVSTRLQQLEEAIGNIPKPAPADLSPVSARLQQLEEAVRNIPKPAPQREVDLKPVKSELTVIRNELQGLPRKNVDLKPVTAQIVSLEKRVRDIPRPGVVDLKPVGHRLGAIETEIGKLGKKLERPAASPKPAKRTPKPAKQTPKPAKQTQRRSEPKILSGALYGKKDDLKQISGVGPKLEKLLNKNGVFYFWQVASWSRSDIDVMDDRLDTFKGRILRDNWVAQATQLKQTPGAARIPADY